MGAKISKSPISKGKIAFSLIIAAIIIINIVAGALIFLDIRVIKSPEVTIELDLVEINSNEAILQTTLSIKNPNQFGLIIKNIEAVTKTNNGAEIMHMLIKGGEIAPNNNKTYTSTDHVTFDGEIPETLTTKLTGIVGFRFLGIIKKTLPVAVNMITSLGDVVKNIAIPILHIKGDFGEITNEGINFTTEIGIENPNSFDLQIGDISITLKTETGELIEDFAIKGDMIAAKSSTTLNGEGRISIETLNAKTLFVTLSTTAGVIIAGITEFIDFSTGIEIAIPHVEDIFPSDTPTVAFIDADMRLTRQGILNWGFTSYMTLELRNPNKIGLIAKDVIFSIYRVDDGEKTLIGDCTVNETEVGPENSTFIPAQIYLPSRSLFRGQRIFLPELPDGLLVVVEANVTIPGLDQAFWIGVSGYQDMHPFT